MTRPNFKFELSLILLIAVIYCLNRFWLKETVEFPVISVILKCYFNDWMAGIGIIAYINLVLDKSKYRSKKITSFKVAIIVCLICGILWENVFPRIFPHGVCDIWDVVAYIFGGITYIIVSNLYSHYAQNKKKGGE